MTVERTTPQLVKKGKGKKRPGYRGDAAYGRSSRSSQATSIGQARGATGKGGGASLGGGRDRNEQPAQQFIGGKSYNVTPETRGDRDRAQLKQQIMNQTKLGGNRIDKFGNTKKNLFRGGGGGIGSLLASLFGMAMGIPGLGLLTGGFGKIKEGLGSLGNTLGDFRENFTGFKTQAEYDQAMFDRRQQKRLDKLFTAKDRGYNQIGFGDFTKKTMDFTPGQQAKIDDLLAQGYTPSTARNVLTGRDLKGFTPSRMGLQTMTPMAKPTFSDPFANTVGTTTKVNAPSNDAVSSVTPDYSGIQDYGVDINVSNNPNSFSKNLATHLDNNAKFAAARDAGLISDKDYNTLGGFDVTQQLAGGNPVVGGLLNMFGSPVYNTLQGFMDTAGQPRKDIADMNEDGSVSFTSTPTSSQQLGAIPGTVTRNTLGGFGLMSPELKTTYYDILNPQDFADGGIASMFTRRR